MRIVGGIYKGRVLEPFEKIGVRPTSDMTRESLFNIIQFKVRGARFLDLFCGTGAMGIEALSRGASHVVFNDASRESIKLANKNLLKLKITDRIEVFNRDAICYLQTTSDEFDIVFIDPPYDSDLGLKSLGVVSRVLKADGVAIYESEKPFDSEIEGLKIVDRRRYGRANLTFFKKGDNE